MRRRTAAATLAVALVGCGASGAPHPTHASSRPSHSHASGTPTATPSPTPTAPAVVAAELVLRADLSARPANLRRVASIPFGPARTQVGLIDDVRRASLPLFPPSFTVAPDGSFWLVDEVKHRLVHLSPRGDYIGQIGGIRFDRFHPQPQDLVSVGDALYLLEQDHQHLLLSSIREFRDGHQVAASESDDGERPVVVIRLVSGSAELIGVTGGEAGDPVGFGQDPRGYAELVASPGPNVRYVEGVPVGSHARVNLTFPPQHRDDQALVSIVQGQERSIVPIRFVVTPDGSEHARHLLAAVGAQLQAVLPDRIVAWVPLAPSRPADADRYGGGAWLLEFPIDGSALVWDRLPDPGLSSEGQVRHLAAGPGGTLYLMQAERGGMVIYAVPTS